MLSNKNEVDLNIFKKNVETYLKCNTVEDLCRLIFKCIPRRFLFRILKKMLSVDTFNGEIKENNHEVV